MTQGQRPTLLKLTVVSGPDAGLSQSFRKTKVALGRDTSNDFVLSDGFVSNRHGEFIIDGNRVVYRDLKSRHGSLVMVNNVSTHLHDQNGTDDVEVEHGTELQVGCSVLKLVLPEADRNQPITRDSLAKSGLALGEEREPSRAREQLITAAHEPVQALTRRFQSNDRRLEILFRLAGQLNALSTLDEVLERIVEATFDAFPAANFFAITLISDPEHLEAERAYFARTRGAPDGEEDDDEQEPIISTSILRRVIETRESVLFVKDSLGFEVSQSILDAKITACLCAPLVGQRSLLGVMQVDTRGRGSLFSKQDLDLFSVLASNVAFALERAKLAESIVEMFESFVEASVTAIEARDPTTAGHSQRVASYTVELAEVVNEIAVGELKDIHLSPDELTELRYAALLHDFGKIAVREDVLQKGTRLPELHMDLIEQRFETIKALRHNQMLRHFAEGAAGGAASPEKLQALEADYRRFEEELDTTLVWLDEVTSAPFLSDHDLDRIRKLGEQTYVDAHGQRRPLLTPFEVENLSIRRGTLNESEWQDMKSHAARSEDYLQRIPWSDELQNIPCIAGAHHEKLDGSGYPVGLAGDEIIPQVRMLTIADIFDALTAADRPYRKAATVERAVEILHLEANDQKLDKRLVDVFERLVVPRILPTVPSVRRRSSDVT